MSSLHYDNIDAYYQCYKQKDALRSVLKTYRTHYTDTNLVLISDGGLDFAEEAKQYNCIYSYEKNATNNKNLIFDNTNKLFTWAFRFFSSLKHFKNKYFILLEDDVFIFKKIKTSNLQFNINGCNENAIFPELAQNDIRLNNIFYKNKKNIFYGGCGGCVFDTQFFKDLEMTEEKLKEEVEYYCNLVYKDYWASDAFITFLCLFYGGTIGNYEGFCETWHSNYLNRLFSDNIEVLHQYKVLYK